MKSVRGIVAFLLLLLVVVVGISYIRISLRKAAAPPAPGRAPSLEAAPVRLYGLVEPLDREVFVGPQGARRVEQVLVHEGQDVSAGQVLCELEQAVERQLLEVATSKVKELEARLNLVLDELHRQLPLPADGPGEQRALQVDVLRVRELEGQLDLVLDDLQRIEPLSKTGAVAGVEHSQRSLAAELVRREIATATAQAVIQYSQKSLEAEALGRQIETARAEVELRRRELDTLSLRSPVQGRLYKFDVRLGEQLTPQDYQRIVIGRPEKQVRVFVESFWLDRVRVGQAFRVQDAETLRTVGSGRVVAVSDYVGARNFRSEDAFERLDTKYAQAVLHMEGAASVPLGKLVVCVREDQASPNEPPGSDE